MLRRGPVVTTRVVRGELAHLPLSTTRDFRATRVGYGLTREFWNRTSKFSWITRYRGSILVWKCHRTTWATYVKSGPTQQYFVWRLYKRLGNCESENAKCRWRFRVESGPIRDFTYADACAYFNIILLYGHDNVTPPLTGLITIAFGRLLCAGTSRRAHIHGIGGGSH